MTRRRQKRRRGLGRIDRNILEELTIGDLLYAHLLSATLSGRFYKLARERANERYRRKRALERLEEMEYIKRVGERLSLTQKGATAIGEMASKTRCLLDTEQWDDKWRIATYDIPEKYAALRNKVRDVLKKAGFIQFQRSIWIFPHHCEELVQLIKTESRLADYIFYGVLERIEDEDRLKKLFKLK